MQRVKVLIVDDSALIRNLFTEMLSSDSEIEVVGSAEDPYDAREKIKQLLPDVITLDVEMPKMDGISFLEKIMSLRPMPVVMASSLTVRGADVTLQALEIGAVDYIAKPAILDEAGYNALKTEIIRKVKQASNIKPTARIHRNASQAIGQFIGSNTQQLIAIGASTGGVEAVRDIVQYLPANMPPVVATLHMPEVFTASFAKRLDSLSSMTVTEAVHGEKILPGHVYIAPGGFHLQVHDQAGELVCVLNNGALVSGHRPSVDALFFSVAKIKNKRLIGAILTGMGRDGADGLLEMKNAGAITFGQSEGSCVVYGMPKAAKLQNAVQKEVPLSDMPKQLISACTN